MIGRSGRLDLACTTLLRKKADCAVMILYDAAGAVVGACALVLLGVTKPDVLVSYFESDPWIAWSVFGALGPVFAIGVIDRFPIERLVELPADGQHREIQLEVARGVALRRRAVERMLAAHYDDVRVALGSERRTLLHRCKRLIHEGHLHFDDIATQVKDYGHGLEGGLPPEISKVLDDRSAWPTDHDPFDAALTLVGIALDQDLTRPLLVACRIADGTRP
ncbi:MAG TPA: hypothetical protein VFP17_07875 [Solirubrobacterales bacterium]|nr:hypothetical protein [Solirubrobacterales bacterium]